MIYDGVSSAGSKEYDEVLGRESDRISNYIVQDEFKIFYPLWIARAEDIFKVDMYLYATPEDRANRTNPLCGLELDRLLSLSWRKGDGYKTPNRKLLGRKKKMVYQTPMRIYHLQLNDQIDKNKRDGFMVPWSVVMQGKVVLQSTQNNPGTKEEFYYVNREHLVFGLDRVEEYILRDALYIYNTACHYTGGMQLDLNDIVRNRNLMKRVFIVVNALNKVVNRYDLFSGSTKYYQGDDNEDEIDFDPRYMNI